MSNPVYHQFWANNYHARIAVTADDFRVRLLHLYGHIHVPLHSFLGRVSHAGVDHLRTPERKPTSPNPGDLLFQNDGQDFDNLRDSNLPGSVVTLDGVPIIQPVANLTMRDAVFCEFPEYPSEMLSVRGLVAQQ